MNIEQAKKIDIASFVEWATEEGKSRTFKLEVENARWSKAEARIWVYDYDLMEGQHVTCVEDINLEEAKRQKALRTLEEARKTLGITA
jgi:hypothetical protein